MYILVFISNVVLLCAAASDSDIATVPFPNEVTTEMSLSNSARPIVTNIASSLEPFVVTTPITQAATTTSVPVTITPGVIATDSIVTQSMTSMPTTEKTSVLPTSCPSGFVQCTDGKCEPFEALCGEKGIVTVSFPTEVTTEMSLGSSTRPIVTDIVSSGEPSVVTTTSVPVTTTPVVIATDSNGHEICLDGWELCLDGTCEPFHWLCTDHDGSANFTTIKTSQAPSTNAVETTPQTVTESMVKTTAIKTQAPSTIAVETATGGMMKTTAPQKTSTLSPSLLAIGVTNLSGKCQSGFVMCVDGTCEPFEALCGEGGVVTVTYPTDIATTGTIPALSGSPTPVISTSESIAPSTTVPPSTTIFAVPTDSSGKEVCADGWEQCKDGTCEPFHWLCTEHDGSSPIIG